MKRLLLLMLVCGLGTAAASPVFAQANQQAQLRVTVIDQTRRFNSRRARVRITTTSGTSVDALVNDRGQATLDALPVGNVQLHVEADGFSPVDRMLTLRRGSTNQSVTLSIAGLQEEIVVTDAAAEDTRGNSLTTTLEEDEIAELSDDPDELRAQLEAMTGGAGAVFQVNGFRGGRLPNRDEIRQIRFRTNSFSADNHDAGRVQVEIITRPGLTEWSGNANVGLRNDVLNARNAFARTQTPEQFRRFTAGIRGPLVRNRTSLRFNVDGNRSFDSGTIVALLPDGRIGDQVKRPFEQTNVTAALEHGFTTSQTFRFEYRRSEDARHNLGVGDFNLMERAYDRSSNSDQVRASVQSILRPVGAQRIPGRVQPSEQPFGLVVGCASCHRDRRVQQRRRRCLERRIEPDARGGRQLRLQHWKARDARRRATRERRVHQPRRSKFRWHVHVQQPRVPFSQVRRTPLRSDSVSCGRRFRSTSLACTGRMIFASTARLAVSVGVREELQSARRRCHESHAAHRVHLHARSE